MRRIKPLQLTMQAFAAWNNDGALQLGAALAYYAVFSISPFLTILLSIGGIIYKGDSAIYIHSQIVALAGARVADAITGLIQSVHSSRHTLAAGIVSTIVLFIAASSFFVQLENSMNQIWGVEPRRGRLWKKVLKERLLSFGMILGFAFILMVSVALSAGLSAGGEYFGQALPAAALLGKILKGSISFTIVAVLFASIFKVVPNTRIAWKDVWMGALLTALLFTVGKLAIGWYLGHSRLISPFGAAGSILVVLAWIYYSSQILFFGAEFTKIYAREMDRNVDLQKIQPVRSQHA